MELNQLRCFVCAAEHQSISSAAKVLLISQPSLSRILKNLEEDLGGVRLFVSKDSPAAKKGKLGLEEFASMPQILFGGHRYVGRPVSEKHRSLGA